MADQTTPRLDRIAAPTRRTLVRTLASTVLGTALLLLAAACGGDGDEDDEDD